MPINKDQISEIDPKCGSIKIIARMWHCAWLCFTITSMGDWSGMSWNMDNNRNFETILHPAVVLQLSKVLILHQRHHFLGPQRVQEFLLTQGKPEKLKVLPLHEWADISHIQCIYLNVFYIHFLTRVAIAPLLPVNRKVLDYKKNTKVLLHLPRPAGCCSSVTAWHHVMRSHDVTTSYRDVIWHVWRHITTILNTPSDWHSLTQRFC